MKRTKRLVSVLMIMVMMISLLPVRAYAQEAVPGNEVTEQISEDSEDTFVTDDETEQKEPEDFGTTEEEQVTPNNQVTEESTMEVEVEESTTEESTSEESITEENTSETLIPKTEEIKQEKASVEDYPPTGVVLNAGSWGNGYKWYVYQGPKANQERHYIFCLEHGKTMETGKYSFEKNSGVIGTKKDTFRMAVAMHYFKKHGGWASESGYTAGQLAVWNMGGSDEADHIIKYANALWELTELNTSRASGNSSYKNISAIASSDRKKAHEKNIVTKQLTVNSEGKVNQSITVSGSAWKYFASGAGGWGGISVDGIYDTEGTSVSDKVTADVSTDGKVNVSYKPDVQFGNTPQKTLTIVFKITQNYAGSSSLSYLDCGLGKQKLSFDAAFSSPAYFAMKIYANSDKEPAALTVEKVDELTGASVAGAVFQLTGTTGDIPYADTKATDESGTATFKKIEQPGDYYLREIQAPEGMKKVDDVIHIRATEVMDGTTKKIQLQNMSTLTSYWSVTASADNLALSYKCVNDYAYGKAKLQKLGNVFVKYENGQFVYETRTLNDISFDLYAGEDIYMGDTLLWAADTKLTQAVADAGIWNQNIAHAAKIPTMTDNNGNITYENLPYGRYYLVETANIWNETSPGYGFFPTRIPFTVNAESILIHGGSWLNEPIKGHCVVQKVDKDKVQESADTEGGESGKLPLAGAEFTLYAHIGNVNYDGNSLFTADQTEPAVVSRINGRPRIQENTWIPLDTQVTNANGVADFGLELPYGTYMVAETYPPEGYAYADGDSYIFTHKYDKNAIYANGAVFSHVFENQEKGNFILIRKYGEMLAAAPEKVSDYGTYRELQYEETKAKDVSFEIYDSAGKLVETVKTDDTGQAKSSNLKTGTYTVKEIDNGGRLLLDATPQKVTFKKDDTAIVQTEELVFTNKALSTSFRIFKNAEIPEINTKPEDVSSSDDIYRYVKKQISNVVFGVYTKEDIKNYKGDVIANADTCLGYAVTDDNGIAVYDGKLCDGSYYFKEIKTADKTYLKDDGFYDFNVKLNGENIVKDLNKDNPILNKKIKGSIKVIKTDGKTKETLSGVAFDLMDADKKVIGSFITDDNGEIYVSNLPIGTYYLQETSTKKGYKLDDTLQEVKIDVDKLDVVVRIKNDRNDTWISVKTDHTITGRGNVKTGDVLLRFITMLFIMSIMAVCILHNEKKRLVPVQGRGKQKRRLLSLFLILAGLFSGYSVASAETVQGTLCTEIDGYEGMYTGYVLYDDCLYAFCDKNGNILRYATYGTISNYRFVLVDDNNEIQQSAGLVLVGRYGYDKPVKTISKLPDYITYADRKEYILQYSDNYGINGISGKLFLNDLRNDIYDLPDNTLPVLGINWDIGSIYVPDDIRDFESSSTLIYEKVSSPIDASNLTIDLSASPNKRMYYRSTADNPDKLQNTYMHCRTYNAHKLIFPESADEKYPSLYNTVCCFYNSMTDKALKWDNISCQHYYTGTITYNVNGGTNYPGNPSIYNRYQSYEIYSPSRKDHIFKGWYTDPDFAGNSVLPANGTSYTLADSLTAAENISLYAKWEYQVDLTRDGVNYRIGNTGTASVMPGAYSGIVEISDSVSYNGKTYPVTKIAANAFADTSITDITIPESVTIIESGAFDKCSSLKKVHVKGMFITLRNAFPKSVDLEAFYDSQAYSSYEQEGYTGKLTAYGSSLTYVLDGGTNHPDNPENYAWRSYLLLQAPVKEGYRFDGWYTDAAFQTSSKVTSICQDTASDMVLYAKWIQSAVSPGREEIPGKETQETGGTEGAEDSEKTEVPEKKKTEGIEDAGKVKAKITKIANLRGKKMKVCFKKTKGYGYQIKVSNSKNFKKAKTYSTSKSTYTIQKLKKKTYYIKARTYKMIDGTKVYGKWSGVKKVKIKK